MENRASQKELHSIDLVRTEGSRYLPCMSMVRVEIPLILELDEG